MLSSNEVYYTDESAQGKNFFKKFSDLVIGLDYQLHPNTSHIHPHMCG